MMPAFSKLAALTSFLLSERSVSPKWLFRTHTKLFEGFLRQHQIEVQHDTEFTYLRLDGVPFVWPRGAEIEPLKHLVAELTTPNHPHEYDCGLTRLSPQDIVLDIGACEGAFAVQAAERGAHVIAVEPSPAMHRVIERLFVLRQLTPPRIEPYLLGAEPGVAYFRDNVLDPARSEISHEEIGGSYSVRVRTIDDLVEDLPAQPTYLKCDAEGADLQILRGGRNYLRRARPKIAVTTYHKREHFQQIRQYLGSLGYRCQGKGLMYVTGKMRVMMIHAA